RSASHQRSTPASPSASGSRSRKSETYGSGPVQHSQSLAVQITYACWHVKVAPLWILQIVPTFFPTQNVSLQLPQVAKPTFSVGGGSNEGSLACASPGDGGAERIAARFALAASAGVAAVCAACAREPINSSAANARKVSLSFMRVSFEGRFTGELRRVRQLLKEEGARAPLQGAWEKIAEAMAES